MTKQTEKKPAQKAKTQSTTSPSTSPISDNIKFNLSIPWADVVKAREEALEHLAEHAEIEGFRKGKAPKKLVAERIGKQKLFEHAIEHMLPRAYSLEVQHRGILPVVNPQITPISLEEDKAWEFEIQTAEAPKVELGNYQDVVKGAKSAAAIWTPGKDKKQTEETEDEKLRKIFTALLEKIQIRIPELLIRTEVNRSLSNFLQQLDKMRIPLEDYLKSVGKTADSLREEYAMSAITSLQLEFLLSEIARQEKITASDKELEEVFASLPSDEIRKANDTPQQRLQISAGLVRKKTVARLLAL